MAIRHLVTLTFGAVNLAAVPLTGQEPQVRGSSPDTEQVELSSDTQERMTVPVMVEGTGPYRFLVDTGAERTTIASELARDLRLPNRGTARLHSMSEASDVQTVLIKQLSFGSRSVAGIHAPTLRIRHVGAEGILGIDSLQSQQVLFDFETQSMTVASARKRIAPALETGTIVVRARRRSGRLVVTDARADGAKLLVIIDSGSAISVANTALRTRLARKQKFESAGQIELMSVTGGLVAAEIGIISEFTIGGVTLKNLLVAFSDVHPFAQLQLGDEPALFLGMNAFRAFERVLVDFPNRKVLFQARELRRTPAGRRRLSGNYRYASANRPIWTR